MNKHKRIIYGVAVIVLSVYTLFEIKTSWNALIAQNGIPQDKQIEKIKETISLWEKRVPFSMSEFGNQIVPTGALRVTPTKAAFPSANPAL